VAAPFAYVTNLGVPGTVSVIDMASNTAVAMVPVGSLPFGVAVAPDGKHVYVANFNDGTVSVIDTASNTVVATVPGGAGLRGVAITPDGTRAYVANVFSNNVSVIATASNTVVATVAVGDEPEGVAVTPDGTRAYVTNFGSNNVSVIATASQHGGGNGAGAGYTRVDSRHAGRQTRPCRELRRRQCFGHRHG
jgi:YVTN family beta-propeller protein